MPVTAFASKTKIRSGFDPVLAREQLLALQTLHAAFGTPWFCQAFLMVLAKKEFKGVLTTRLVPFVLNRIQLDLQDKKGRRNIVLKPRQIGSTTWHIICRLFLPAILEPGTSGLLISQTKPYGAQHFRIFQRALKNFARTPLWLSTGTPDMVADDLRHHLLHTQFSARHEILFDFLDSKVLVDTSENPNAGSGLTIQNLVGTETHYWGGDPETLLAQAKETVPQNGTVDIESTPNGMGGYFFEEWQRAQEDGAEFRPHFYPWWWQEEYQQEPEAERGSLTEEEQKMAKEFQWTMKQVAWRRDKQRSLRARFPEKYAEDPISCFVSSGDLFFDKEILRWLRIELQGKKPLESYHGGQLKIFKRRIKGRRYVIGADCAEGKLVSTDNSDWNAAMVLDIDTGEQVALYRSRLPPEEYAQDLVDLGEQYNHALLAIERNGPGASVLLTAQRHLLYGNIYYHKEWYRERKQVIPVAGLPTQQRTRPIMLNKLASAIRNAPTFIHSEDFVNEALTFIWAATKKRELGGARKPQGAPGTHDDVVLATGLAEYARLVSLGYLDPIESPSEGYGDTEEPEEEVA